MDIKGGCLCGAVRYSATVEQAAATVCHCRDCQKFTGSAFATLVAVPKEALTIDGTMQTFSSLGGSGKPILRHFCPQCGASLAEESVGPAGHADPECRHLRRSASGETRPRNLPRRRAALGACRGRRAALCQTADVTATEIAKRRRQGKNLCAAAGMTNRTARSLLRE